MSRCSMCGKNGLFLFVDILGKCKECIEKEQTYGLIFSKEEQTYLNNETGGLWVGNKPKQKSIYDMTFNELVGAVSYSVTAKKYELAEKLLLLAEGKAKDIVDLHFCYNHWIELLYKQRDNTEYLNRCIKYCKKDIDMYPEFEKEWANYFNKRRIETTSVALLKHREEIDSKSRNSIIETHIPSFERLAIIYEKQGYFEDAVKINELALSYKTIKYREKYEKRLVSINVKISKQRATNI